MLKAWGQFLRVYKQHIREEHGLWGMFWVLNEQSLCSKTLAGVRNSQPRQRPRPRGPWDQWGSMNTSQLPPLGHRRWEEPRRARGDIGKGAHIVSQGPQ